MTQGVAAGADLTNLLSAVTALRDVVEESTLPLDLPDVPESQAVRVQLLRQLDDYVIPRLASVDAPLLAVIGGSTGAGKSTLVNSMVGSTVSRPGVLRPTTRSPVLVHHPSDATWFTGSRILAGLARVSGEGPGEDPSAVRLVASDSLPAGLALLDAPDIDSVVTSNRDLANQLLAAADLWLFVTTAARYADAVPWDLLRQAAERGTSVAIVLDRVPAPAVGEIRDHLGSMLSTQGLAGAPIFTVVETTLSPEGFLPHEHVARLHSWLTALARDARARSIIIRQTLTGALDSLEARTETLRAASQAQLAATTALGAAAETAYAQACDGVTQGMSDGTLLRGEVLARWQEFVGTGEFFKQVETTVSRVRDRVVAAFRSQPVPIQDLGEALQSGVAALIAAEAQGAASVATRAWRNLAGGHRLLEREPALGRVSPGFDGKVETLVRDWQGDVLSLVREEGRDRRTTARVMAYGVNGLGVVLMLVAFAHTGGLTGAEAGIAGGTALLGQKILEAIFGDQAVRELAVKARRALLERVQQLYYEEQARYRSVVESVEVRPDQGRRLAAAVLAVRAAR
ncbi:MAG: dynamin family protein [Lapillicoccus sp.]